MISMPAQDVPPAPATSICVTPASTSCCATAPDMPAPTSFTITVVRALATRCCTASRTPRNSGSPSGWSNSCSGLRCTASARAPTISTARSTMSSSDPSRCQTASCAAPRLAMMGISDDTSRTTVKLGSGVDVVSAARMEPTPIAMPACTQALAMPALIRAASG